MVKGCTDDDKEHCRMTTYLDQKRKECSCVPWEFPNIGESEVNPFANTTFLTPHHPQNVPTCSSNGRDCYEGYDKVDFSACLADCEGLYADIDHFNESVSETSNDKGYLDTMIETYESYKRSQIESFTVVHDEKGLKTEPKPYQPLRVVQIYFDTATFDKIDRDVKVLMMVS